MAGQRSETKIMAWGGNFKGKQITAPELSKFVGLSKATIGGVLESGTLKCFEKVGEESHGNGTVTDVYLCHGASKDVCGGCEVRTYGCTLFNRMMDAEERRRAV